MSSSSPSLWQNPSMVPSPVPEEGLGGMQGVVHMSTNLVRGRRALRGRDVFRFRSEIANTGNRYRQLPKTKHQELCHINPRSPISHQYTVSCHSTLDASIPRIFNLQPGAQRHPSPSTASTPGHTLRGAGVKWRTTRSRAGPSSCATTLWRPATDSICLSCISMLCASHMSTTTRSRSPAAHRLMEVVVVNIDSTVSPLSFLFPLLPPSHHRYTVPSPTVPTTVPTTVLSTPRLLGSLLSFLFSMLHES